MVLVVRVLFWSGNCNKKPTRKLENKLLMFLFWKHFFPFLWKHDIASGHSKTGEEIGCKAENFGNLAIGYTENKHFSHWILCYAMPVWDFSRVLWEFWSSFEIYRWWVTQGWRASRCVVFLMSPDLTVRGRILRSPLGELELEREWVVFQICCYNFLL